MIHGLFSLVHFPVTCGLMYLMYDLNETQHRENKLIRAELKLLQTKIYQLESATDCKNNKQLSCANGLISQITLF